MSMILDSTTIDDKADELSNSEIYWLYNGLDCCVTYDVFNTLDAQMDDVSRATYNTSIATLAPVMEMMLEGLPVSLSRRSEVEGIYRDRLAKLEADWQRLCVEGLGLPPDRAKRPGRSSLAVNPASPKDVQFLFHEVLGLPEKRRKKKGADFATVTTDRATLEDFRSYFHAEVFVNYILAMRDAGKAIGFLRSKLDADNRLRCSLNVAGTNTGRLSSSFSDTGSGSNLQNISGRLKDIFVAEPGWSIVDVDLEQGDSRGVAAIAWNWFVESHGEEWAGRYLDACESGDLHSAVCRMAWPNLPWGDDPSKWRPIAEQPYYRDKSYRDLAKVLGHGSNYGSLPATAAANAKLPIEAAEEFQRAYFTAFPCIVAWQERTLELLETTRTLTTPFGRRRYFWGDPKASTTRNAAIAYAPQSTTGEFINRGAINLWFMRNRHNLPIRFLLQVHDSLVLAVRTEALEELMPRILDYLKVVLPLERGREFSIPTAAKVGWNYGGFDPKENPYGLKSWKGSDDRKPPRPPRTLVSLLNTPVNRLS